MQAEFKVSVKTYWNKSGEYELIDTSVEEESEEQGLYSCFQILICNV